MNIKGVSSHNVINLYNSNKSRAVTKGEEVKAKDRIEISELGKSLTTYSPDGININNSSRISELKNRVESGTYNIDAKLTAQSMIDNIKGSGI